MKDTLNYLEVHILARELQDLIGARVDKIYHPSEDEVLIQLYSTRLKKATIRIFVPNFIVMTEYKIERPETPSHFCMFLRKYLNGARIAKVSQKNFERIIEIHFEHENEKYVLINELFSKGNIIICDSNNRILVPLKAQVWKDRTIKAKETYSLPPQNLNLEELDFPRFKEVIFSSGKDQIVKSIATALGIGGTYAEEICLKLGIEKEKFPKSLKDIELRNIFKEFNDLLEKTKSGEIKAYIAYDNKQPIDVQPFELKIYEKNEKEYFESFNNAVDTFFVKKFGERLAESKSGIIETEIIKQEALLRQHQSYFKETEEKVNETKQKGDLIYSSFDKIKDIIETIIDAREKRVPWDEIIQKIEQSKGEGNETALLVKNINPNTGIVTVDLNSGIEIDITKTANGNANDYYEQSKKLQAKLDGIVTAIEDVEQKISDLKSRKANVSEFVRAKLPKQIEKKEKEWYQKFIWMQTSKGKLVIAGRDATQNEILIKKYLEENDIVLHADVQGSPFTIIKGGKDADEEEITEAASLTLCHSRAWQNKIVTEVYWVHPHQVSKTAPAGEYIAKGGFMIYGKKNYLKDLELRYAIGIQLEPFQVISGPVDNVRHKAKYYAVILPGKKDKDTLSKDIKSFMLKNAREDDKELVEKVSIEEIKEHAIQNSDIFGMIE